MTGTDRLSVSTASPTVQFYLSADEISHDAAANTRVVRCYLRAVNRGNSTTHYLNTDASVSGSVNGSGFGVSGGSAEYSSGLGPGGTFWEYGPYDITVSGSPDGSAVATVALSVSYPQASGHGGSTSTSFGLSTQIVIPGIPSGLALARNTDAQATLTWTNNGASNGQPTSVQVQKAVNGGAFAQIASIAPSTSLSLPIDVNQKVVCQVRETNGAGSSAWSASSGAIFTTPAAPTSVAAAKDAGGNIVVTWTPNVAFTEHQHVILHGTLVGTTITWDGSPLATVASGTSTYTHVAPSPSAVHVYAVLAKNTDTAGLQSAQVQSNSVQLLAPPNKPTLPTTGPNADRAAAFDLTWTHNPVDTTPQTAYEASYSTNGGTTWTSTGKTTSATSANSYAPNTFSANQVVQFRVRTWGSATTGGADGAGASPWSDQLTLTFKTRPVVTITSPSAVDPYAQAALAVQLGFTQAEGASFVNATIDLYQGATLLEEEISSTLSSTSMTTRVANGGSYAVKVRVRDSNGLLSDLVEVDFTVDYTEPVLPTAQAVYLAEYGVAQLTVTIPPPAAGEVAAAAITVTRNIDGDVETIVDHYAAAPVVTILDMTPTIHGSNEYLITAISADGATVGRLVELEVAEDRRAFLSSGTGYSSIISFMGDLQFTATPARASALVETAGRARPIALFGESGSLSVSGSATLVDGFGSSPQDVEDFLLTAGIVCYRDPSGRRMFGAVSGSVARPGSASSAFQYKVSEAS